MDSQNPLRGLTSRATFLDKTISESIQTGPSALAVFDYPHDSWKEAADVGGHAGSDAVVAEVIARLQATLPPACAIAALEYRTFATMISGPRFSDHRNLVVDAVKHVNAQPIVWRGVTLPAPRVVAALAMSAAPETITSVGLVYEAASLVFGTAVAVLPDRVVARIYREGIGGRFSRAAIYEGWASHSEFVDATRGGQPSEIGPLEGDGWVNWSQLATLLAAASHAFAIAPPRASAHGPLSYSRAVQRNGTPTN